MGPWGLVAGEGCFTFSRASRAPRVDGSVRLRFVFELTMASRDRGIVEALRSQLEVGSIRVVTRSTARYLEQVRYNISSRRAHFAATIPFMEHYLLPSAKRVQYEQWRDALFEHDQLHPSKWRKGPSVCSEPGCGKPVRGRSLCRSHYYRATGY